MRRRGEVPGQIECGQDVFLWVLPNECQDILRGIYKVNAA